MRIKVILLFLLCIGAVSAGSPSIMTTIATVGGGAGIIASSSTDYQSGNGIDSNLNAGTAGSRVITGPGSSSYTSTVTLDASNASLFDSSSELYFDGGGVYDDTATMTDAKIMIPEIEGDASNESGQTPSTQSVSTHTYGMGDYAQYTADKVIDDANLTTDYRAEGGSGVFSSSSTAEVAAGSSKKSGRIDFTARRSERVVAFGNSTSSLTGSLTTKYHDFSRPRGFGDANMSPLQVDSQTGEII